jgi:hypothetical protein
MDEMAGLTRIEHRIIDFAAETETIGAVIPKRRHSDVVNITPPSSKPMEG